MSAFLTLFDMIGTLAARRLVTAERCFARIGLNHTEARLLSLLHEAGGQATQDELSSRLLVDRSNAGRALKRLEAKDYVARQKSDADGRSNTVRMMQEGAGKVLEIAEMKSVIAESIFGQLGEEEAAAASQLLAKAVGKSGHSNR